MTSTFLQDITIIKRNGKTQRFDEQKITDRITRLIVYPGIRTLDCNAAIIVSKTKHKITKSKITTSEIDELTAQQSYEFITVHPDYGILAARIKIANLHKHTDDCFSAFIDRAANNSNITKKNNPHTPLVNGKLVKFVKNNKGRINRLIEEERDFNFDWLGTITLIDRYLLKRSGDEHTKLQRPQDYVIERPQYLWMRISCMLALNPKWLDDSREEVFDRVKSIYTFLSMGYISLATPTMKNAGTLNEQLLSCFLLRAEDSTESIMKLGTMLAKISKGAGGTGWSTNFRPLGSEVKKTNGRSGGERPFLKIYESVLSAFDQGGNRPGSGTDYKRIWEAEFPQWIRLRRPHEPTEFSIRKLFYACWLDDYFMECVEKDLDWYYLSQYEHPQLVEMYGAEFKAEYISICDWIREDPENRDKHGVTKARKVWDQIMTTIIETGMPYMLSADRVNELSNQKNIGNIHNSNLCVTGDTTILTSKGVINIKDLQDQDVDVWNGEEWSPTTVRQTNESADIMYVEFEDGSYIYCTPYHKFYTRKGIKLQANELKIGTQIEKLINLPVIEMKDTGKFKYAYTEGFFSGDGSYSNGTGKRANMESKCNFASLPGESYCSRHLESWKNVEHTDKISEFTCNAISHSRLPQIALYGVKKDLKDHLETIGNEIICEKSDKIVVRLPIDIAPKFSVPFDESIQTKLEWLAGLLDADGTDVGKKGMTLSSIDKQFLYDIKLMIQTLGINTRIVTVHKAGKRTLPDGKGGSKEYDCKEVFLMYFGINDIYELGQLGFNTRRLANKGRKLNKNIKKYPKVSYMCDMDDPEPTYCFTELKRGRGVFNGILTSQCAEIVEVSTENRVACCCLGTLPVNMFLKLKPEYEAEKNNLKSVVISDVDSSSSASDTDGVSSSSSSVHIITVDDIVVNKYEMDWPLFTKVAHELVWILNKVIDINDYPIEEARLANMEQRPLGIGIQGVADAHAMMKMVWGSPESRKFASQIAEVLHFACLTASNNLAIKKKEFYPYFKSNAKFPTIDNSPLANGIFQWQQWHSTPSGKVLNLKPVVPDSELSLDWTGLRKSIMKYGVINSLVNAYPPTASSSNIQGKIESFEPFKNNAYLRKTISGTFIIVNKYLIEDLQSLGLWNKRVYKQMINDDGSIQKIDVIPEPIKKLYRTAWEIDPLIMAEISACYAPWVDQTLSDNIFIPDASDGRLLTRTLLHRRNLGLKTLMYYCKQTNVKGKRKFANDSIKVDAPMCLRDNPDCEACQ
jgi:ribonucleoside-diphosphate reductase alpha chain